MNNATYPVRILHVVTHLNRYGLESRIMDIYRNIDRTKVQFDFLIHRNDMGDFGEEIKLLGGRIYVIRKISPPNFMRYLDDLNVFFAEHKEYKIVHAHLNTLSTWVLRAAKKNGVPVRIAHSRNASMEKDLKTIPKFASKLFINRMCTDRFACSRMAGKWLFGEKYIQKSNFRIIPNAFQIDKFIWNTNVRIKKREELGVQVDEIMVVNVARFSEQKNHLFLLDIFEKLHCKKPNTKLYLAGEGECEEKIRNYIAKKGLQNSVVFLGLRSDIPELYQAADLFIFPSKYEGFGTVLVEAQVTNLPTVTSSTIPNETKLCECVTFVDLDKSVDDWAGACINLFETTKRFDNSQCVIKSGFDIRTQYKWLEEFYLKKWDYYDQQS